MARRRIRLRTPAPTQRRGKTRSIATAQKSGTRGGAFVGEHGRWDRPRFNGYKVFFVPFSGGRPSGKAEDVVTGFLNSDERPADGQSGWPSTSPVPC
jgi:hypothetical protein